MHGICTEFLDTTSDVQIFAVSKIKYTIQFATLYSECTVHCTHIHVRCIAQEHAKLSDFQYDLLQ